MAEAMKIHLKKNAAANGLELKERLQGLTATDVTHSRKSKAGILIFHIWPHKYCENSSCSIINSAKENHDSDDGKNIKFDTISFEIQLRYID